MSELRIGGLQVPKTSQDQVSELALTQQPAISISDPKRIAAAESVTFQITLKLPDGYKLNKLAPVRYKLTANGEQGLIGPQNLGGRHNAKSKESIVSFAVPLTGRTGKATFEVAVSYTFCREGVGGLCKFKTTRWLVPLEVANDAKDRSIILQAADIN